jgi:hypothetical protein
MTDLHDQIRAAIEARRGLAQAASDGPWTIHGMSIRGFTHLNRSGCLVVRHTWPQEAAHIVANDPATILRHCDEDLDVLKRHALDEMDYCSSCFWKDGEEHFLYLRSCPEVLSLARRYGIEAP